MNLAVGSGALNGGGSGVAAHVPAGGMHVGGGSNEYLPATQPQEDISMDDVLGAHQGCQRRVPQEALPLGNLPESLSTCFVPHCQVTGFVWAVIRRCVPAVLLGGKRCRKALRQSIRQFVSLRRYEQMNVQQIMQRQKISEHRWVQPQAPQKPAASENSGDRKPPPIPPSQAAAQQRLVILWLGWLFSVIVVPLLRAHFFCTESEAYRQQVFYYRKPVWYRLSAAAVDGLVGVDGQFAPMISNQEAENILRKRSLGVAKLRLLPKRSGKKNILMNQ